jgi:hypothetical protein
LGPPPPGYGRYADFDRGFSGGTHGGSASATPGPPRRNLDDVLCFKVCCLEVIVIEISLTFTFISFSVAKRGIMRIIVETEMFLVIVEGLNEPEDMEMISKLENLYKSG